MLASTMHPAKAMARPRRWPRRWRGAHCPSANRKPWACFLAASSDLDSRCASAAPSSPGGVGSSTGFWTPAMRTTGLAAEPARDVGRCSASQSVSHGEMACAGIVTRWIAALFDYVFVWHGSARGRAVKQLGASTADNQQPGATTAFTASPALQVVCFVPNGKMPKGCKWQPGRCRGRGGITMTTPS